MTGTQILRAISPTHQIEYDEPSYSADSPIDAQLSDDDENEDDGNGEVSLNVPSIEKTSRLNQST